MNLRHLLANELISLGLSKQLNELFMFVKLNAKAELQNQSIQNVIDFIKNLDDSITYHREKLFITLDKKDKQEILKKSNVLNETAKLDYTDIVDLLIKEKAYDPQQLSDDYDDYPHCYAIKHGSVESLKLLHQAALKETPSINIFALESTSKKTLLQLALNEKPDDAQKQEQMINYLLEQKLNANKALVTAAVTHIDLSLVKKFIQYKAEYTKDTIKNLVSNIKHENSDKTLAVIKTLLEAYPPNKEELHDTLLYAIKQNYFKSFPQVIPLIEKFTDKIEKFELNIQLFDVIERKYMYYYHEKPDELFNKLTGLITAGADINCRDHYHRTPLYYAVLSYDNIATKIICDANPSIETLRYSGYEDPNDANPSSNLINLVLQENRADAPGIIKLLVNAGVPIKKYAINYSKERENRATYKEILIFLTKAIQERTNREKQLKSTPYNHVLGNELTLFSKKNCLEEKQSLEDQCNQFLLQILSVGAITANYGITKLIRTSFLNQQAIPALLTEIRSSVSLYSFLEVFKGMIDSIKLFNYSSHIITTIIKMIQILQDAHMQFLFVNQSQTYREIHPNIALSYCLEYPTIVKALLKFCPFEQLRLLGTQSTDNLVRIELYKAFSNADLFDLLFYLENRKDDGENQVKRKEILCNITEFLRNENYKEARGLIFEKSMNLRSRTSAFFNFSEKTMDILSGILQRYNTQEEFELHARRFITYVEIHKNAILSEVLAKPKLRDPISKLMSNTISNAISNSINNLTSNKI